jgi:hypothetical protein
MLESETETDYKSGVVNVRTCYSVCKKWRLATILVMIPSWQQCWRDSSQIIVPLRKRSPSPSLWRILYRSAPSMLKTCSRRNAIALPLILVSATFSMPPNSMISTSLQPYQTRRRVCHCRAVSRKKRKNSLEQNQYIMNYNAKQYDRPQWLAKKPNPVGWLCGQPRFILGLRKALQSYKRTGQSFPPHQFIAMDADTYFDMEQFQTAFEPTNG